MMARRRKSSAMQVSLFPFLSILACVIGTLTLMITALALGQMDEDEIRRIEAYYEQQVQRVARQEELTEQIAADREALARVEAGLAGAEAMGERVAKLTAQLRSIEARRKEALADQTEAVRLQASAEQMKRRIDDLTRDLDRVRKEIAELQSELAKRKRPPPEAVVTIQPGGSGQGLDPSFVECRRREAVIHSGKTPKRIPGGDLKTDPALGALLGSVAGSRNGVVVFLVRSDGLDTYRQARDLARYARARNGKLPVIGQGRIDLSVFGDRKH